MNMPDSRAVRFFQYEESEAKLAEGEVVVEAPILIRAKSGRSWRVMAVPKQLRELAVGLLFAENVPDPIEAIESIEVVLTHHGQASDDSRASRFESKDDAPVQTPGSRAETLIDTSGYRAERAAGATEFSPGNESSAKRTPSRLQDTVRVHPQTLYQAMDAMNALQDLRERTRGTHAMALIDVEGNVVAFAEDVGRHNALDKVIGRRILDGRPTQGLIAVMSSRVSHEMAMKAILAGVEACAAVSAPTSLAIDAARQYGLTIACFVRGRSMTVFTHPERVVVPSVEG